MQVICNKTLWSRPYGLTVLLHKSLSTHHYAICVEKVPGSIPLMPSAVTSLCSPWSYSLGGRANSCELRILNKGELGLNVPHEPGDYSFVV